MKNCRLVIYSFLSVNTQFTKCSKLSKNERIQLTYIKEYNKNNENQSLRVKLDYDLKFYVKLDYFYYFSHSYTLVLDMRKLNSVYNQQYVDMFFKLMPFNKSNAPIINIEQIGDQSVQLNSLRDRQAMLNFKIPQGKLKYIQRVKTDDITFNQRLNFQELELQECIIGRYFLLNLYKLNQTVQKQTQLREENCDFKKAFIRDSAIVQGKFFHRFTKLETLISINSYYSEHALNIIKDVPLLRKLIIVNDSEKENIYLSQEDKQELKYQFPQSIINQMKNLKILKFQVDQIDELHVFCKQLQCPTLLSIVIQFKANESLPLLDIISLLRNIDTKGQIVIETGSIQLIDGTLIEYSKEKILQTFDLSLINALLNEQLIKARLVKKEKTKSKLQIDFEFVENKITHKIKIKQIQGFIQSAFLMNTKMGQY